MVAVALNSEMAKARHCARCLQPLPAGAIACAVCELPVTASDDRTRTRLILLALGSGCLLLALALAGFVAILMRGASAFP